MISHSEYGVELTLVPDEEPDTRVIGKGNSFGEAAFKLLDELVVLFGYEALEHNLFHALNELEDYTLINLNDGESYSVSRSDFSCPEAGFTLTSRRFDLYK